MSQPPPYNPYNQPPPMPQAPPGYGAPQQPYPGQPPAQYWQQPSMPPGQPYPQQGRSGHPVGAFFLGAFASVVISLAYSGIVLATYLDQTKDTAQILYMGHALLNGAAVGALIGLVGRRSGGAWFSGAVIAPLGAFFGYTNAVPMIIADANGFAAIGDMMEIDPFIPAKAWWGSQGGTEWVSLLGLVIAAATAWVLAYAVGRRR